LTACLPAARPPACLPARLALVLVWAGRRHARQPSRCTVASDTQQPASSQQQTPTARRTPAARPAALCAATCDLRPATRDPRRTATYVRRAGCALSSAAVCPRRAAPRLCHATAAAAVVDSRRGQTRGALPVYPLPSALCPARLALACCGEQRHAQSPRTAPVPKRLRAACRVCTCVCVCIYVCVCIWRLAAACAIESRRIQHRLGRTMPASSSRRRFGSSPTPAQRASASSCFELERRDLNAVVGSSPAWTTDNQTHAGPDTDSQCCSRCSPAAVSLALRPGVRSVLWCSSALRLNSRDHAQPDDVTCRFCCQHATLLCRMPGAGCRFHVSSPLTGPRP
jgi:hypothetical protein